MTPHNGASGLKETGQDGVLHSKLVYNKIRVPDSLLSILTCTSKSPNSEALPKH